jgi:hypothetical protein
VLLALAAVRTTLAIVFAVSAVSKLRDRDSFAEFRRVVRRLPLVPRRLGTQVAVAIATAEAAVVVLLVVPPTVGTGLALATALLAILTAGVTLAVRAGISTSCRCFGSNDSRLSALLAVRNAILGTLTAVAAAAWFGGHRGWPSATPDLVSLAVLTVVAVTLVIHVEDVAYLVHDPRRAAT